MAILRLVNGADVEVKLSVEEAISALKVEQGVGDFIEMPTAGGPVHIRPSSVVAVVSEEKQGRAGFR